MTPSELNKYSSDGLLCVVVKCFDNLEELTASIFKVTGLIEVDATVIWKEEMCWLYRVGVLQITAAEGSLHDVLRENSLSHSL